VAEGDSNFKPERPWLSGRPRKDGPSQQPALSNPHLVLLINYSQVYPVLHENLCRSPCTAVHFHPFSLGRVDFDLKRVFLSSEARRPPLDEFARRDLSVL